MVVNKYVSGLVSALILACFSTPPLVPEPMCDLSLPRVAQQQPTNQDIDIPSIMKVRPGHLYKVQAKTNLRQIKWICLDPDVDLVPSDDGRWIVVAVNPSVLMQTKMRSGPITYKVAAYGAKIVGADAVPTDPVYMELLLDTPPLPPLPPNPPVPPVPPGPEPNPPVPPNPPAPIPLVGNRVLVIYESSELSKYPATQTSIVFNAGLRGYLNQKCTVGPDGKTKDWWILDKDTDVSALPKIWQDAMRLPRTTLPWIVISTGTTGFSGPLPADVNATMDLLKRFFEGGK